tara:strand:+ start:16 stop:2106 length:2091 start_codon:yes stop_codon:yes gene_type:complete
MTIERKLLGTTPVSGEVLPEAVSFDGTSDYLGRSSDLTGNTNGKAFTFSAWVYHASVGTFYCLANRVTGNAFYVSVNSADVLTVKAKNTSNTTILEATSTTAVAKDTWTHLVCSIDLTNTSNRSLYANDVPVSVSYVTYTNDTIDFTSNNWGVAASTGTGSDKQKGRLAHIYLDKTYRDLSTESNRRLFIDADGKPSSTIPSSPILYLPMTDAATAGSNSGTGGDFTVNGVLATAERGPNQDNCSASTTSGASKNIRSTSLTGATSSKLLTVSFNFRFTATDYSGVLSYFYVAGTTSSYALQFSTDGTNGYLRVRGNSSSSSPYLMWASINIDFIKDKEYNVSMSVDLSDVNKRHVIVNGVAASPSWNHYVDTAIDFSTVADARVMKNDSATISSMGEHYLDQTYIDLSTSNPFWDSDTNRPNSVRKVIEDTGVTPLIALPLMGNDAGNNLGSGGDFTVNSGPYVGARGGSEFWARSVSFNGSTGILSRSVSTLASKTFSIFMGYKELLNTGVGQVALASFGQLTIKRNNAANYRLDLAATNASSTTILAAQTADAFVDKNVWVGIFISCDMAAGTIYMYSTFAGASSMTTSTISNDSIDFSTNGFTIGDAGKIANHATTYFTTDYIDFSQESNRNKFVDQLGYPKNLGDDGSEPTGSSPLVYMKFNDTAALGTNSGTAGNFTTNSGVTAGPDFTK